MLGTILYKPHAWLVLAGGAGWLLAMRPQPIAFPSLVAALVLFLPINIGLVMAGVDFAVTTLIMQGLSLLMASVILVAGALRGR